MADSRFSITELIDGGMATAAGLTPRRAELSMTEPISVEAVKGAIGAAGQGGLHQADFGSLIASVATLGTPQATADWFISAKYQLLGGQTGFLGAAQTAVSPCPDHQGFYRHFAGGSIYYHPLTGAHEIHGDIRSRYAALGWERSFLGYPVTDEQDTAEPPGRVSRFQHGAIFWRGGEGTREVHGDIYRKYVALGADHGLLGRPMTDETGTPDGVGRFNHFAGGSIYWKPSISAHEVHGLIRQHWASAGWERNAALGYPISDEQSPAQAPAPGTRPELAPWSKNRFSDFENGVVHWFWGGSSASPLAPYRTVVAGVHLSRSASEVLEAARPMITAALGHVPLAVLQTGPTYAGVTDYSFDGVSVHNRRYRIDVDLHVGLQMPLMPGIDSKLSLELLLEVGYDPLRRDVVGFLTGWTVKSVHGSMPDGFAAAVHRALDPVLWAPQRLWHIPEQNGSVALTILAVKVLPNGDAGVYVEPLEQKLPITPGVITPGAITPGVVAPVLSTTPHS